MSALQMIQAEAKKIRKVKPSMKYVDAIKQASIKYNAGKLGAAKKAPVVKRKSTPKLPVKKIVTTVTKEKMSGGTIGLHTYITIDAIGKELELLQTRKKVAIGVAQKKLFERQFKALKAYLNTKAKFV